MAIDPNPLFLEFCVVLNKAKYESNKKIFFQNLNCQELRNKFLFFFEHFGLSFVFERSLSY